MRGTDKRSGELFSYVDLEQRVRADHPLRAIRSVVGEAPDALSGEFAALYSGMGRPSIAPEMLLRAMLLQAFYSVRSERQLMERLEYDLLFRWFVGLGVELQSGVLRLPEGRRRDELLGTLDRAIARFGPRIVAFDRASAEMAAELRAKSGREGRPMAAMDAQIAGIAGVYGLTLVTRNAGDFEGTGIDLVDPWEG